MIAAFSARRHDEIDSLRDDCITETEVGILLRSYIEKTIRDLDSIPVPYSVKVAVDVLLWLSEARRNRTGERWIVAFDEMLPVRTGKFEVQPEEVERSGKVQIYRALERFSAFVETPPLKDGTHWVPRPHQFRRWFGVTYYNRYRFPQLLTLAHFYRHNDPNQTRRYITERNYGGFIEEKDETRARERFNAFNKAGEEFRQERFLAVAEGKETMTGFGGEFLKRELDRRVSAYSDRLEIGDDRAKEMTLIEAIAPLVKATKLEPNEQGHSYCKCGPSQLDLAQAECVKVGQHYEGGIQDGPNPAYACDEVCGGCAHNVCFDENERYLGAKIAQLESAVGTPRPPGVREIELRRLAVLTEQRKRRSHGEPRR